MARRFSLFQKYPLAILTEHLGLATQTFIDRHITKLLPGSTVVISETVDPSYNSNGIPALVLGRLRPSLTRRAVAAFAPRSGSATTPFREIALRRFLRRHGVEVILGEHLDFSHAWLSLSRDMGIRLVPHGHGNDVSGRLRDASWGGRYRDYDDTVITISQSSRSRLIETGLDPAKIHVVPSGVDVPSAPPVRRSGPLVRFLAVGRMVGKKAPISTLDAFRRLLAMRNDVRFDFVGDGPLMPAVHDFVRCFRLDEFVTLHGALPHRDVQRLMLVADVFVQHSMVDPVDGDEEGLPVSILEAMAAALPIVSTRHAGIPDAVEDRVTGYLVEEGDSEAMAARLAELAGDAQLRTAMGQAGWRRAHDHFTWEHERRKVLQVIGLEPAAS